MPTPRSVSKIKESLLRPALTSHFEVEIPFPQADLGLSAFIGQGQDNLNLRCSNASLPGSNLATLELNNTFHGVTQRHAYRRVFDDRIDLEFFVDAEKYNTIRFFEKWIDAIMLQGESGGPGPVSQDYAYRVRYSDDYVSSSGLKVKKFERDYATNLTYTFVNAYPFTISSMPVSYDSSSLLKCTVSFSYLRYVINNAQTKSGASPTQKPPQGDNAKQTPALNKENQSTAYPPTDFSDLSGWPVSDVDPSAPILTPAQKRQQRVARIGEARTLELEAAHSAAVRAGQE